MRHENDRRGAMRAGTTVLRVLVLGLLWGVLCGPWQGPLMGLPAPPGGTGKLKVIPLHIGAHKFMVEIADTNRKRALGLMYRRHIPDDFGMLFVHAHEEYRGFWMKNCKVSLDIIFLDREKRVINMHINVPPCVREPCPTYDSKKPAKYVLELRAGRALELKLKPGDPIFFIWDQ